MVWPMVIAAGASIASGAIKAGQARRARKQQADAMGAANRAHASNYSQAQQAGAQAAQAAAMQQQMSAARGSGTLGSQASAQQAAMQRSPQMAAQAQLAGARIGEGYAAGPTAYMGAQTQANTAYGDRQNAAQNAVIGGVGKGAQVLAGAFGKDQAGGGGAPIQEGVSPSTSGVATSNWQPTPIQSPDATMSPDAMQAQEDSGAFDWNPETNDIGSDRRMKSPTSGGVYSDAHSKAQVQKLTAANAQLHKLLGDYQAKDPNIQKYAPRADGGPVSTYVGEPMNGGHVTIQQGSAQMEPPPPAPEDVKINFGQAQDFVYPEEERRVAEAADRQAEPPRYFHPEQYEQQAVSDAHSKAKVKKLEGKLAKRDMFIYEATGGRPEQYANWENKYDNSQYDPESNVRIDIGSARMEPVADGVQPPPAGPRYDSAPTPAAAPAPAPQRVARHYDADTGAWMIDADTQEEGAHAYRSDLDPTHKFGLGPMQARADHKFGLAREPRFSQGEMDQWAGLNTGGGGGGLQGQVHPGQGAAPASPSRGGAAGRPMVTAEELAQIRSDNLSGLGASPNTPYASALERLTALQNENNNYVSQAHFDAPKPRVGRMDISTQEEGAHAFFQEGQPRAQPAGRSGQSVPLAEDANAYTPTGYGKQDDAFLAQMQEQPQEPAQQQGAPVASGTPTRQDVGAGGSVDLSQLSPQQQAQFMALNPDFAVSPDGTATRQGRPEHGPAGVGAKSVQPQAPTHIAPGNTQPARQVYSPQPNAASANMRSAGGFVPGKGYSEQYYIPEGQHGRYQVKLPVIDMSGAPKKRKMMLDPAEEEAKDDALLSARGDANLQEQRDAALAQEISEAGEAERRKNPTQFWEPGSVTSAEEARELAKSIGASPKTSGGRRAKKKPPAPVAPTTTYRVTPPDGDTYDPVVRVATSDDKTGDRMARLNKEERARQAALLKRSRKNQGALRGAGFQNLDFLSAFETSDEDAKSGKNRTAASMAFEKTPGYSYEYKPEFLGRPGTEAGPQVGIMAQDLEKSPAGRTVVKTGPDGMKKVDTGRLALLQAAAMHDLIKDVDELKKKRRVK